MTAITCSREMKFRISMISPKHATAHEDVQAQEQHREPGDQWAVRGEGAICGIGSAVSNHRNIDTTNRISKIILAGLLMRKLCAPHGAS